MKANWNVNDTRGIVQLLVLLQLLVLFVLAAALVLGGFWLLAERRADAPATIGTDRTEGVLPTISVEHAGVTYLGAVGGHFCWQYNGEKIHLCSSVDFDPTELDEVIPARRGDTITVHIEADSQAQEVTTFLMHGDADSEENWIHLSPDAQADTSWTYTLDGPVGTYILEVYGRWEQGNYIRAFNLEL